MYFACARVFKSRYDQPSSAIDPQCQFWHEDSIRVISVWVGLSWLMVARNSDLKDFLMAVLKPICLFLQVTLKDNNASGRQPTIKTFICIKNLQDMISIMRKPDADAMPVSADTALTKYLCTHYAHIGIRSALHQFVVANKQGSGNPLKGFCQCDVS